MPEPSPLAEHRMSARRPPTRSPQLPGAPHADWISSPPAGCRAGHTVRSAFKNPSGGGCSRPRLDRLDEDAGHVVGRDLASRTASSARPANARSPPGRRRRVRVGERNVNTSGRNGPKCFRCLSCSESGSSRRSPAMERAVERHQRGPLGVIARQLDRARTGSYPPGPRVEGRDQAGALSTSGPRWWRSTARSMAGPTAG